MYILHLFSFRLQNLLVLAVVLPLIACSGGDGGLDAPATNALGLTWTAPSEREDSSGLSLSEIAGYRIYYGVEPQNYQSQIDVNDGSAVQAQVSGISRGTYYVVLTTIDVDGRESAYSSEVIVTI